MGRYIAKRLAQGLLVIAGVTVFVFVVTRMVGDPVKFMLPLSATEEQRDARRAELGFDRPIPEQFVDFLGDLTRLDLGESTYVRNQPALDVAPDYLPRTFQLVAFGMVVAVVCAVPLGILAARRPGSVVDRSLTTLSLVGLSVPQFFVGFVLLIVFTVQLRWFESGPGPWQKNLVLPAVCLALPTCRRSKRTRKDERLPAGAPSPPMSEPASGSGTAAGGNLVDIEGLTIRFPVGRTGFWGRTKLEVHAVDDVSLTIGRGETLGLVGESGSGKTTIGRAGLRRIDPAAGAIRFDGRDITHVKGEELRRLRRRMQLVFQDPYASLNPRMSVLQLVAEPLVVHGLARNAAAARDQVVELLDRCGLPADAADRRPHAFSGGQRQRVGIARALALQPELIVADEPVSALDVSVRAQVVNLLQDLQSELRLSYLFISHDLSVVRHISHRIAILYAGKCADPVHAGHCGPGRWLTVLGRGPGTWVTVAPVGG